MVRDPEMMTRCSRCANLRIENPDVSLREIGELCSPPLSRSAVNYRLKRLMEIAQKTEI